MTARQQFFRIGTGLLIVTVIVIGGMALIGQFIPTWGATTEEVRRPLPGDQIVPDPLVKWTHGITINAPLSEVWGWVSQIGEGRGGFYSYTFIENQMGNGDVYHNADHIVPEWQNPESGTVMIQGGMALRALEPGKWYLGVSTNEMGWTWLWYLEPMDATHTRLIVRSHIKPAGAMGNDVVGTVLNLGGFVMEQAMLQGIKARAEGVGPPSYSEPVEIALWFLTLGAGLLAAYFFVTTDRWLLPGITGVLAVLMLLVFTFIQPPVGLRIYADMFLFALLGAIMLARFDDPLVERAEPRSGKRGLHPIH